MAGTCKDMSGRVGGRAKMWGAACTGSAARGPLRMFRNSGHRAEGGWSSGKMSQPVGGTLVL